MPKIIELFDHEVAEGKVFTDTSEFVERFFQLKGKPIILYQFQRKYYSQVNQHRYVVKARQIGMSQASAWEAVKICMTEPETLIIFLSITFPQAVNFLRHAKLAYMSFPDIIRVKSTTGHGVTDILRVKCEMTNDQMRFENGSVIVSIPNNPDTARGYAAARVYWDERAKFPHESEMVAALLPTTARGGLLSYISTHRGTSTSFYSESVKAKRGELEGHAYLEVPWDQCPDPMYQQEVKKFEHRYGKDSFFFREEFACIAVDESVAMFPHELIRAANELWTKRGCKLNTLPIKGKVYAGIDIGHTKDQTVIYIIEDYGEYAAIIYIEEWVNKPYEEQKLLLLDILNKYRPHFVHVDSTGPGEDTAEWLASHYGSVVECVKFTPQEKDLLVVNTYIQMHAQRLAIPSEEDDRYGDILYNQLRNVQRERSERSGNIKYVQLEGQLHDDHFWAFCLATAYMTSPNAMAGTYIIGSKESSMISDTGEKGKWKVETYRKKSLMETVGAKPSEVEIAKLKVEEKKAEREWTMGLWKAEKVIPCTVPNCDGKMFHQQKLANSDEYVCDKCKANLIRVRKK